MAAGFVILKTFHLSSIQFCRTEGGFWTSELLSLFRAALSFKMSTCPNSAKSRWRCMATVSRFITDRSPRECLKSLGDDFVVCLPVCSSTPWLRCGFRRHQSWTPVSSITAAHSWATCSTSAIWCRGECELTGDDVTSRGAVTLQPSHLCVSLCRFDFANSNVNDENLNKMNPHHVPDVVSLCGASGNFLSLTNTDL